MKIRADKKWLEAGFRSSRSRILYQITGLIVAVLAVSGLATFLAVRDSQERLIDNSVEKLMETNTENTYSTYTYVSTSLTGEMEAMLAETDAREFFQALMDERIVDTQRYINQELARIVEGGLMDIETVFNLPQNSQVFPETAVVDCDDESLRYTWEVPDRMEEGEPYIFMEEGIPEPGLNGEYLIVLEQVESSPSQRMGMGTASTAAVIFMAESIAEIEGFYDQERTRINMVLAGVIGGSIPVVSLISFFILSYLIRRGITEPIDELSDAAERVMEGDLDVEVTVHEGGDFQGLERAFKEMVASFRKMIMRSVSEQ
ncbi:MAG: HAMP domain-containing protein [Actinomycetota bacterium]|nr:HAMP domain-containing protein [Actinomycetota bacterium]